MTTRKFPIILRTAKFSTAIRSSAGRYAEVVDRTQPGVKYRIHAAVMDQGEFFYRIGAGRWCVREDRGVTTFREDRPLEGVK